MCKLFHCDPQAGHTHYLRQLMRVVICKLWRAVCVTMSVGVV